MEEENWEPVLNIADAMVMSWDYATDPERLDMAETLVAPMTKGQRAMMFVAMYRLGTDDWRRWVVRFLQSEWLKEGIRDARAKGLLK